MQTMNVGQGGYTDIELEQLPESYHHILHKYKDTDDFSGNSIHHAYHIYQYELRAGRSIADFDVIVEFGGGFGETCRMVHELGFTGQYYIFDFPEFAVLQEYYLDTHLDDYKCVWNADMETVAECDLLIAEWSLSEAPEHERKPFLDIKSKNYLMAYGFDFFGQDNNDFFDTFKEKKDIKWDNFPIAHQDNKSAYLIGYS